MPHYIPTNDGSEIPGRLVAVDTETVQEKPLPRGVRSVHRFRLACAETWLWKRGEWRERQVRTFRAAGEFWDWLDSLQSPKQPVTVWAHNLGFDLSILDFWRQLDQGRFQLSEERGPATPKGGQGSKPFKGVMVLEPKLAFLKLKGLKGKVNFSDLFNYYPCSLKKIGSGIGLQKLDHDPLACSESELETYCRRDCEIVAEAVKSMLAEWSREKCGVWQPTAAKLAWTNWRHTYLKGLKQAGKRGVLPPESPEQKSLERDAYYGGWTEPFFYGRICQSYAANDLKTPLAKSDTRPLVYGPIYELDFQSFYPSVMADGTFPRATADRCDGFSPEKLRTAMGVMTAVAEVCLESPDELYPTRREGKTYFARGVFTTSLAGAELKLALDNGHVARVLRGHLYQPAPLFRDWVRYWWGERVKAEKAGHGARALFCKTLLNSLYGKFGQRGRRWVDYPLLPAPRRWGAETVNNPETGEQEQHRYIAGNVQIREDGDDPQHVFPAVSACITAAGRVKLREAMKACPSRTVLYVSTDALYVLEEGYKALLRRKLIADGVMGKLRIVDVHPDGEIAGCGDLRLGGKIVKAGVPLAGRLQSAGDWQGTQFETLPSIIARVPDGTVQTWEQKFQAGVQVWKNRMRSDGWSEPWEIGGPLSNLTEFSPLYDPESDASRL